MNTEFGHSVGDSVLLALARRIVRLLPPQDMLARLQGDSFAVIVLSETEPAAIEQMTRELLHTVKAAISVGDRDVFMTASVGIAPPPPKATAEEQVRRAEAAVYQAKRYGGDYVQFYEPAFGMRSRRIDIDSELRKALEAGNIDIVYQPIVRLEDNSIAGFEALTRWEHPLHGRIPTVEFIAAAEESGLIVQLGLYVLEHAARELASWQSVLTTGRCPSSPSTCRAASCCATTSSTT